MAWRHGTQYGYARKGCRCPDCKAAMRSKWNRAVRPGRAEYDRRRNQGDKRKRANKERMRESRMALKLHVWYMTQVRGRPAMLHPYCEYCGHRTSVFMLTIDRVIPGCQGGEYVDGNMVLCCSMCNSHKAGLRPDEWTHPRYYEPGYTSPEIPF